VITRKDFPIELLHSPITMMSEDLEHIDEFSVFSPKLDGERGILYMRSDGAYFYNSRVEEELEDVSLMQDYVFDVERIGQKFYILDIIYANGRPVMHLNMKQRIMSVRNPSWTKDFAEMQRYVPGDSYEEGMFDAYEGIIIQKWDAPYDRRSVRIFKVKKVETVDLSVVQGKVRLQGQDLQVSLPDNSIVEVEKVGDELKMVRERKDKNSPNHEVLQARALSEYRMGLEDVANKVKRIGRIGDVEPSLSSIMYVVPSMSDRQAQRSEGFVGNELYVEKKKRPRIIRNRVNRRRGLPLRFERKKNEIKRKVRS